ncbi:phosphatidate cytidylyltransferase [Thauera sp. Sel9]|uniref:phosphatidate cytidylyltransferase n=1 Tax=Thauera sp. Sel9 TaxID=2974299 RepID=UPI0021E1893A|nr:phosphatidate cytidylyltransferase [Thauera sp. Sel9]MCV2216192.1 phosphatidate cytidylyltransferase [Thauera sp. Sel9]
MLKARIITAIALLVGLLAAVFLLPPAGWLVFCALLCSAAAWEWGALAGFARTLRVATTLGFGALCLLLGHLAGLSSPFPTGYEFGLTPLYVVSAAFWLVLAPSWLVRKWQLSDPVLAVLTGFVVLVPTALALIQLRAMGPGTMLIAMATVWVADIAAYFAGRAFGKHKLAPAISPGKTWEGAAGAVLAVMCFGLIVHTVRMGSLPDSMFAAVLVLVLWTAISIVGDLYESLLKRQAGLKDSGSILPGHGGLLDRIDSLTSTLPTVTLLLVLIAQ